MTPEEHNQALLACLQIHLATSPDMIFIKDTSLVYLAASHSFAHMVGHTWGEELVGKTDFELFPTALAEKYTEDDRNIFAGGVDVVNYIEPLPELDGKKSYSSTSKYLVRGEDGTVLGLYGVARDVTAEVALEAERESSRLSRQMFDSVLEADLTENKMLHAEGSGWVTRFGLASDALPFTQALELLIREFLHPDFAQQMRTYYDLERLKSGYHRGDDEFCHIVPLRGDNGAYRWTEFRSRVYHSRVSNTLRLTTFIKDTDEDERQKQTLRQKAVTDALTGLHNRESILSCISKQLREQADQCHALFFIDLDCFKQVNDRWGHRLGDVILQTTARRLEKYFDRSALLGRIGGDEFLVFLPSVCDKAAARDTARALVRKLAFRYCEQNSDICITYSIGVSFCSGGEANVEQLCDQADRAMYRAKERGRNQVYFYDDLPTQ